MGLVTADHLTAWSCRPSHASPIQHSYTATLQGNACTMRRREQIMHYMSCRIFSNCQQEWQKQDRIVLFFSPCNITGKECMRQRLPYLPVCVQEEACTCV